MRRCWGRRVAEVEGGGLRRVVEPFRAMTPGQRWTASLTVALGVVVLAFGFPQVTRLVVPQAAAGAGGGVVRSTHPPTSPAAFVAQSDSVDASTGPSPAPAAAGETTVPAPAPADAVAVKPALPVVALVDPAAGTSGRDDAAMATLYLHAAGLTATVVPLGAPASTCAAVGAGRIVIAGGPLPPLVHRCLTAEQDTVIAWDDAVVPGASPGDLSTRRGVARSLLDTALRLHNATRGKVALVADQHYADAIRAVRDTAARSGLKLDSEVWLPDDGRPPATAAVDLAGSGVGTVLFATTTARQAVIASQLQVLSPGVRFVVLDAADSITSQSYPPAMDGATAVTSVQFPWYAGAAQVRATCRSTWETAQSPPVALTDSEVVRELTWCQHVAMVSAARAAFGSNGGDALRAVLGEIVQSPLTSPVRKSGTDAFGPAGVTTATWSATCGCWASTQPFVSDQSHG